MNQILLGLALGVSITPAVVSLPPPEDIPEEILRTEVITEGRSPQDGSVLTAAEYATLQAELAEREYPPEVNEDIQQTIFLLQLLKLFRTINPL